MNETPMQPTVRPLQIGSVLLPNNLALAPMAGVSDLVYRRICHRLGAGLTVTELVSARGLIDDPAMRRSWRYLAIDPRAGAMAIQLFGAEAAEFSAAITCILAHPLLGQCHLIDINMGCPVKKVVVGQAGSALLREPDRAAAIVRAAVQAAAAAGKPVTVKFRSGWDESSVNAPEFARLLADAGAAALTIHARTRSQFYGGRADWSVIAAVKRAVSVPVFGNGDIWSTADAARMLAETGVDGLMIGRAAQGNPWIFTDILQKLNAEGMHNCLSGQADRPCLAERIAVVIEHMDGLIELLGERTAVREMRRHFAWYVRGQQGAARLRVAGMRAETRAEMLKVLEEWRITTDKSCEDS